jgi:hypothetical protein
MSAIGLFSRADAAPVLSGGEPVLEAVGAPEVRERVAVETVPLMLLEGMMEADAAAVEALEIKLATTEEAEAATELALDFALATADETEAE